MLIHITFVYPHSSFNIIFSFMLTIHCILVLCTLYLTTSSPSSFVGVASPAFRCTSCSSEPTACLTSTYPAVRGRQLLPIRLGLPIKQCRPISKRGGEPSAKGAVSPLPIAATTDEKAVGPYHSQCHLYPNIAISGYPFFHFTTR